MLQYNYPIKWNAKIMKNNIKNYSLSKKFTLNTSLVVNIALLLLISFLWHIWIYFVISAVAFLTFLILLSLNKYVENKLMWLILVTALPIFGTTLYIFNKRNNRHIRSRKIYNNLQFRSTDMLDFDEEVLESLKKQHINEFSLSNYLNFALNSPIYQNCVTKYLPSGEKVFEEIFNELKQAKKYILIETYVIREGKIWETLFSILKQKAREGVEIKILYDPLGCKHAFSDKKTFRKLENYKIDCITFKTGCFGHGNHRKLFVIDGVVGFVGGANITDKYTVIPENPYWEQSGLKITGDAVWNMAVAFFNDWEFSKGKLTGDFINYKPDKTLKLKTNEYVQPFTLTPLNNNEEYKNLLINVINNSQMELNILSSVIQIDGEIKKALKNAVSRGVQVNIVVSSMSDKATTFAISKGYYSELIKSGVNIYEYTNGFIRSKVITIDRRTAIIGSMNLDTRWLDLKYENGVLIHSKEVIKEIDSNIDLIKKSSKSITLKECRERSFGQKLTAWFYRFTK